MKVIQKTKKQMYVPIEQAEAAVRQAQQTAAMYYTQLCGEHMIIMLHDEFGFGRDRCTKAIAAYMQRLEDWANAVDAEWDAETFRMSYKEKHSTTYELAHAFTRHDEALEPLVYGFKPYTDRYSYVGEGRWKR